MSRPVLEITLKDAREVLGVSSASTPAEVRQAFREAAKRAHPDAGGDESAFHQVVEAYNRLQDPLSERLVHVAPRVRATPDPDLEISPRVALEGGEVDHRLPDGAMIRITLPAGLRSGDKVRAGDAELCVYIRAQDGVIVRGDDVWLTVKVAPGVLKKGGRVSLDTPLGRRSVWIDRKAAERGLVRVEGDGLPARGRRAQGHLFLRLCASPGLADSAALALLRRFAAAWAA
jgi:curved DNA-binding protein